jgi:cytochrome c-type biogenesis protein CcmE
MNLTGKPLRVGVTVAVLALAPGALFYATLRDGTEYFKHVDEVLSNRQAWEGKRLQLHGYVVPGSILQKPNTLDYRFKVQNNGRAIDASYTGIVPDTFKDEAEVVLRGRLMPQGFQTEKNGVVAKCPSKYVEHDAVKKAG